MRRLLNGREQDAGNRVQIEDANGNPVTFPVPMTGTVTANQGTAGTAAWPVSESSGTGGYATPTRAS